MNKEDEELIGALMLGDAKGACQLLDTYGSQLSLDTTFKYGNYVQTPDGRICGLCREEITTPLDFARKHNMQDVEIRLIALGARGLDSYRPKKVSEHRIDLSAVAERKEEHAMVG